jgi:hypothetical protein
MRSSSGVGLSGGLRDLDDHELGRSERRKPYDDVDDAEIDVLLDGRLAIDLDEVCLTRGAALEGPLPPTTGTPETRGAPKRARNAPRLTPSNPPKLHRPGARRDSLQAPSTMDRQGERPTTLSQSRAGSPTSPGERHQPLLACPESAPYLDSSFLRAFESPTPLGLPLLTFVTKLTRACGHPVVKTARSSPSTSASSTSWSPQ